MDRRSFVKSAGVLTIMAAGGQVWRALAQGVREIEPGAAFEPWRTWREDMGHGPLPLVRAAIISSNAYNSQPWLFRVSPSRIEVFADTRRNLGAFDPYLREMTFSLGCALENLLLAAAANGYEPQVRLAPGRLELIPSDPKPQLAAQVDLSSGKATTNELYDAIPHRHTNRNLFDPQRPLPEGFARDVENTAADSADVKVFLLTAEDERKELVEIIAETSGKFTSDPDVRRSTRPWFRTSVEEMDEHRDGALILPPKKGAPPPTLEAYRELMMSGRLLGLIAVRDRYDRPQTLRAGRVWQRAHLLATARGPAARPANGAVEYMDHERRLKLGNGTAERLARFTHDGAWQPTFMFYMGYATVPAQASVRRPVEDVQLS